jgi:hypothetical protein
MPVGTGLEAEDRGGRWNGIASGALRLLGVDTQRGENESGGTKRAERRHAAELLGWMQRK